MSKTPAIAVVFAAGLLVTAGVGLGAPVITPGSSKTPETRPEGAGFGALESAKPWPSDAYPIVTPPEGFAADGLNHSGQGLSSVYGDAAPPADALPLSQFAGANGATTHEREGMWAFLTRARDGGLPEPASWALMLIGFGMIGGAVRGFVVANRRLARLQPDDTE